MQQGILADRWIELGGTGKRVERSGFRSRVFGLCLPLKKKVGKSCEQPVAAAEAGDGDLGRVGRGLGGFRRDLPLRGAPSPVWALVTPMHFPTRTRSCASCSCFFSLQLTLRPSTLSLRVSSCLQLPAYIWTFQSLLHGLCRRPIAGFIPSVCNLVLSSLHGIRLTGDAILVPVSASTMHSCV